jgi:hypothetical protein
MRIKAIEGDKDTQRNLIEILHAEYKGRDEDTTKVNG